MTCGSESAHPISQVITVVAGAATGNYISPFLFLLEFSLMVSSSVNRRKASELLSVNKIAI